MDEKPIIFNPHMALPRRYRRVAALSVIAFVCIALSVLHTLFKPIPQSHFTNDAFRMHQRSTFQPRTPATALYDYIKRRSAASHNPDFVHPLGNAEGIYFHWDDWVDLSAGDSVLHRFRERYPSGTCNRHVDRLASVDAYFMETYHTKVLRSMAYLYCIKDVPRRVLATTDQGYIEVPVVEKKRVGSENLSRDVPKNQLVSAMEETKQLDLPMDEPSSLLRAIPYKQMQKNVGVSAKDFIFEPEVEIFALKERLNENRISDSDLEYLEFLEFANVAADTQPCFFKYPWIFSDLVARRSHHLYFPFFKRYISNRERQSILQHIIRAWFEFAETENVASWVNYGSLLGWAYNGVNMPWDTDIDVQLPIVQLDRLSRKYNNTLILENPRDGNAAYLFEVSPTYVKQGNSKNFIDARFIDINSGLYIDISALSHTNDVPPPAVYESNNDMTKLKTMAVHCKHWNWHRLDELLPLRHTYFEGSPIYIPKNVSSLLGKKYGKTSYTTKLTFKDHEYRKDLAMWVPKNECKPSEKDFDPSQPRESWYKSCGRSWLLDEYNMITPYVQRHEELNYNVDEYVDYDPSAMEQLPLLRKDAWDYYDDILKKKVDNEDWYAGEN
ncbi:hypothetical protein FT663_02497 [Candidozyma haemuli var. vulneris]|uniref:LicD/FKTN/FKRP nucleotidyltransferase domain-containing protein n=1 Tax=Candidozyma haemuli TaxID=45357 RepID=A0A2V1AYX0_9ASCO|nr:hypothetical protein CXQ85_005260 [[Candida] haemuloni]KAF3991938.1 hypothetical protein FT663_02497 [[Candida] haemuloni var. vulneris]KAF3991953.1 hypothetical protein FT662_01406 [[Candida] haemuloni var. vulneris]PVH22686.1 hypothetical protein CXQ85_005260 [[Candida] haemuloni]